MATASLSAFRVLTNRGKCSFLFQITNSITRQTSVTLSTSSAVSQEAVRKIVPNESFWNKNERMKRPMSPHITIYKFELPALMSVSHRGTGAVLSAVTIGIGAAALVLPGGLSSGMEIVKAMNLPLWFIAPVKLSLIYPFVYHTFNGVRHLIWDSGRGFQMDTLYKSGYFVLGLSLLTSIGIVAYLSS